MVAVGLEPTISECDSGQRLNALSLVPQGFQSIKLFMSIIFSWLLILLLVNYGGGMMVADGLSFQWGRDRI